MKVTSVFAFAAQGGVVFFHPEDLYQSKTLVKAQQASAAFYFFVARQGERQWKKISEVTTHRDGHLKLHTSVQEK